MRNIILASASERRSDILSLAGYPFTIEKSAFEEDLSLKLTPVNLAKRLALGKALTVAMRHPDAIVIGADTFIVHAGKILGKPGTLEKATAMLTSLSGRTHTVITGYAVIDTKSGKKKVGTSETKVTFRALSASEIAAYVKTGNPDPLHLAGGYAIQAGGALFVEKIIGDFYNVVGLPIVPVAAAIHSFLKSDEALPLA